VVELTKEIDMFCSLILFVFVVVVFFTVLFVGVVNGVLIGLGLLKDVICVFMFCG